MALDKNGREINLHSFLGVQIGSKICFGDVVSIMGTNLNLKIYDEFDSPSNFLVESDSCWHPL